MTTGVLLQKLIGEKNLNSFTHIILDEVWPRLPLSHAFPTFFYPSYSFYLCFFFQVHERDQDTDLALLIVRKFIRSVSPKVRLFSLRLRLSSTECSTPSLIISPSSPQHHLPMSQFSLVLFSPIPLPTYLHLPLLYFLLHYLYISTFSSPLLILFPSHVCPLLSIYYFFHVSIHYIAYLSFQAISLGKNTALWLSIYLCTVWDTTKCDICVPYLW